MTNITKEFNTYYKEHIVIKGEVINDLREYKRKNIERLESGINKYNEENSTTYKMIESLEQGSVAMSTMVQSDENDYDIDVAVVFDKKDFNIGSDASKNIFIDLVRSNTSNFKKEPEKLTNCIRIYYEDGYHLDFALFRVDDNELYEHAGANWTERNPRDINKWFREQNIDNSLRKYTRLLKAFCKKRNNMPGGFIITLLVNEALQKVSISENSDTILMDICKVIKDKLSSNTNVYNPVSPYNNLTELQKYKDQLNNLHSKLKKQIDDFDSKTNSREDAIEFWGNFFDDKEYWDINKLEQQRASTEDYITNYEDNEDSIENYYKIFRNNNLVEIKCQKIIEQSPNTQNTNTTIMWAQPNEIFNVSQQRYKKLRFEPVIPNSINYDKVLWKVKNNGNVAMKNNSLRGELYDSNYGNKGREEPISFEGNHYVECYVIKNDICVAKARYNVKIEK